MLSLHSTMCKVAEQRETDRGHFKAARDYANGLQDRLRGLPLAGDSPEYARGYCAAVCDEIDAENSCKG